MCCFWNHAERFSPVRSIETTNKMHTNISLPLIYNHWWTHLVLITKHLDLDLIYHLSIIPLASFQRSCVHHCPKEFVLGYIIILMYRCNYCIKNFLYEFHVNKLNSMYYSNWFVRSYMLFLACFTKCSVKCTHRIRVTFKRNVSTRLQKIGFSHKIGIGHQDLQCKCS